MLHVIGIDAGGTKTVCHLADEHGTLVAEARAGGANLQASGELHVEKVLHDVMEEAIAVCCGGSATRRARWSSTTRWSRSKRARQTHPAW